MTGRGEPRYVRNPGVSETVLDDDVFLVEPGSGEVFYLDAVSGGLWRLFAEPATRADAQAVYAEAFPEVDRATVAADVANAIDEMLARALLVELPR